MGPKVIEWDGSHLPKELQKLPPGRYAIEPVDHLEPLTPEEETGILAGLAELDAGHGSSLADLVCEIRSGKLRRS
jgi:hypothetical protein